MYLIQPICLSQKKRLASSFKLHYAAKEVTMAFGEGETYKKVFGSVFVYLNSVPNKSQFRSL